jgi:hypothetical protein
MRLARIENFSLAAAAVMIALFQTGASAQEPVDAAMIAKIRAEALNRSAAADLFYTLTDA